MSITLHTYLISFNFLFRIAKEIVKKLLWTDDEKIFQETKRIVIAEWQNIVYTEFLPVVLGDNTIAHDTESTYDEDVDATLANVFSTAAFRFGHTLISNMVQVHPNSSFNLEDNFFKLEYELIVKHHVPSNQVMFSEVFPKGRMDGIFCGAAEQSSSKADRFINEAVRSKLFKNSNGVGMDLAARNIQRGRDHGLATFKTYRENVCGLTGKPNFQGMKLLSSKQ